MLNWLVSTSLQLRIVVAVLAAVLMVYGIIVVQRAPLDVERLARSLVDQVPGLLRAKAVLDDIDGSTKAMHVIGDRWKIEPFSGGKPPRKALICIGAPGALERSAIARLLVETPATTSTPR